MGNFQNGKAGREKGIKKLYFLPFTLSPPRLPIAPNLGLHRLQPRALAISRANSRGLKGLAIAVVIPISA
jgi:hypothetical protein